jgi:hypothetical protein
MLSSSIAKYEEYGILQTIRFLEDKGYDVTDICEIYPDPDILITISIDKNSFIETIDNLYKVISEELQIELNWMQGVYNPIDFSKADIHIVGLLDKNIDWNLVGKGI